MYRINLKKPPFLFPLIECLILSLPFLLLICLSISLSVKDFLNTFSIDFGPFYIPISFMIIILINAILYLSLKKRFNLEISTFLYGIGLISSFNMFMHLFIFLFMNGENYHLRSNLFLWNFYAIPLSLLFYSSSIMFKNHEKKMSKTILCFVAVAAIFLAYGIITDFEMIKQYQIASLFSTFIFPILIGLFLGRYSIYKTIPCSPRSLAWSPVLILFIFFIHFIVLFLLIRIPILFFGFVGETLAADLFNLASSLDFFDKEFMTSFKPILALALESFVIARLISYIAKKRERKCAAEN